MINELPCVLLAGIPTPRIGKTEPFCPHRVTPHATKKQLIRRHGHTPDETFLIKLLITKPEKRVIGQNIH